MTEQSIPTPHNGIAVKGCDCGGCFGEPGSTVTEQSTPTPTEARMAWLLNDAGMEGADRLRYAKIIVAAGWKSPAEVAELVHAAHADAWEETAQ